MLQHVNGLQLGINSLLHRLTQFSHTPFITILQLLFPLKHLLLQCVHILLVGQLLFQQL